MAAFVKFWGTRGSIPTPASWTRVYGGNTPCVEVRFDETVFICDCGSGIRELGKDLEARDPAPQRVHVFITHTHWDHIQGFPFFAPVYSRSMEIRLYGQQAKDDNTYRLLSGQMSSDYFPVSFKDLRPRIVADHLNGGEREIEGIVARSFALNHPGGAFGYSFEKDGRKIVYVTDHELEIEPGDVFPDGQDEGPLRKAPAALVEIVRNADLLIMDAQYDDTEYETKKGWGHSSCFSVTDLAIRGEVKTLAFFHHDPESTDEMIDDKVKICRKRAARLEGKLTVCAAREGVEFKF